MNLTDKQQAFLSKNRAAAMITLKADGAAHAVRVGVSLVDGKLWSSAVPNRVRNRHLRRDPRCTLFVFDQSWGWLTLETTATILDGPTVPEMSLRLFRVMQARPAPANPLWEGKEQTPEDFLRIMAEEQRLIYEFEIIKAYGMPGA